MITKPRAAFKIEGQFEYPEYFSIYQKALASIWRPQEVSMDSDVRDWQSCTKEEREVIGGILTGFTQLEQVIGDYWCEVAGLFPKPEIVAMARTFSTFEIIHSEAYSHLSDTLGLDEFKSFLGNGTAQDKVNEFNTHTYSDKVSLGVFSGAGEGVSLFSSFAVLLSFVKGGRFKGVSQIISWSAIDENQHSDAGCSLFRQWVREDGITKEEIDLIKKGFDRVLENEERFLNNIFGRYEVNGLSPESLIAYMKSRANNRLRELGIYSREVGYLYDANLSNSVKEWFEPMALGQRNVDFFAHKNDGGNYVSRPTQDFGNLNLSDLNLELV